MKLILTRHGETKENKNGIIQGHLPGHLSKNGIEQAKKVAARLRDETIDYIYSSDLDRTASTAKEIAKHHPDAPLEYVQDLREKFLGEWQGKSKKELGLTGSTRSAGLSPKDGETPEALFHRARTFLDKVLSRHPNDTVLFAAHNGINKAIIAVITGKGPEDIRSIENLHNTSICIFEIDKDKNHTIRTFNCKTHLE